MAPEINSAQDQATEEIPNPCGWNEVHTAINEYLDGYEMYCEDAEGREGCYTPNERERMILDDAINGLISSDEFAYRFAEATRRLGDIREKEGQCRWCGHYLHIDSGHWGMCPNPHTEVPK